MISKQKRALLCAALGTVLTAPAAVAAFAGDTLAAEGSFPVFIDGANVSIDTRTVEDAGGHTIDYLELWDLATALNGTGSQFHAAWDNENAIRITTGQPYTSSQPEPSAPPQEGGPFEKNSYPILIDGKTAELDVILAASPDGEECPYIRVKDLTKLGLSVTWDISTGTVTIATSGRSHTLTRHSASPFAPATTTETTGGGFLESLKHLVKAKEKADRVPANIREPETRSTHLPETGSEEENPWLSTLVYGDSLMEGILNSVDELNSGSLGCTVSASSGRKIDPDDIGANLSAPPIRDLSGYKTVLLALGTNNWANTAEQVKNLYHNLLNVVEKNNPGAKIYVSSVPPVERGKLYEQVTPEAIANVNAGIAQAVEERSVFSPYGCTYEWVDSFHGYWQGTAEGKTTDGIHHPANLSRGWWEWLKEILEHRES